MRKPMIAGNWKMFKDSGLTLAFADEFKAAVKGVDTCEILICKGKSIC